MVGPIAKRRAVGFLSEQADCSQRRACGLIGFSRGTYRRESIRQTHEQALRNLLHSLAQQHPRYGYRRIHILVKDKGFCVNRKKIQRFWREEGLKVPQRPQRMRKRGVSTGIPTQANSVNQVWSWDFIHDRTEDGKALRILSILDEYSRQVVCLHAARSFSSIAVIDQLEQAMAEYGSPNYIRSDNGPEFIANALQAHLANRSIQTCYIEPGSPWENAFVESFHGKLRDECLNRELLTSIFEAQIVIRDFQNEYNTKRPHSALNYQTPAVIFYQARRLGKSTELLTPGSYAPTSMGTHSRFAASHNNSRLTQEY